VTEADPELFDPYGRVVRIHVLGTPLDVPENNTLLRAFQFVSPVEVGAGRFCWNGACGNSAFRYRVPGDARVFEGRACRTVVKEQMEIVELSSDLAWALRRVVPAPATA
jgi:hypothetical protein